MASITKTPAKPRVTRPWQGSHYAPSPVTITKPNGEVIVIQPVKPKRVKRKGKAKARRSSKPVQSLTHKVSEQDIVAINLAERREQLLKEIGSIHLNDN